MDPVSVSAMESCLQLPEIVSLILQKMRTPSTDLIPPRQERIDFRNVALSCKRLSDPALSELWRIQTSLTPLMLTLPENIVFKGTETVQGQTYSIPCFREDTIIAPEDWERLLYYAPKIRTISSKTRGYATEDVWQVLIGFRPQSLPCLLPNLNRLSVIAFHQTHIYLRILLSPSITHLFMRFGPDLSLQIMRISFFRMMPELCPSIVSLELDILPQDTKLASKIAENLSSFRSLQALACENVTIFMLEKILKMQSLRKLTLKHIESGSLNLQRGNYLPSMKEVEYRGPVSGVTQFSQVLQFISSPVLHTITVATSASSRSSDVEDLNWAELLGSVSWFQTTLRYLTICGGQENGAPFNADENIETGIVAPLASLNRLVGLRLEHTSLQSLRLTSEQLHRLLLTWKSLSHLTLDLPIGFGGLISVVEKCPHLRTLSYSLQPETIPDNFEERVASIECNRLIQSFGICRNSLVGVPERADTVKISLFLVTLFPNLESVYREDGEEVEDAWSEVARMVRAISKARVKWESNVR